MEGVTDGPLDEIADRVQQGKPLREDDATLLFDSQDLLAIGAISDEVRRQLHGTDTTFVRVFEAHVDAVPSALPPGITAGEFRIVGTPESIDAASRAVRALRELAGAAPVFGFTLHELERLGPAGQTFRQLRQAGLDGIAEVVVDVTESVDAIEVARSEGLLVLRATVYTPPDDLLVLLTRASDLCQLAGGLRAFAPLPRRLSITNPTTGYDDVKALALARLLLRDVPSIQVDWPLYGPKLAQVGLTVGADDVDGVSSADGGALGARRSPLEEIRGNIRAAGLTAVERNGLFERIAPAGGKEARG
jgi:aminodeoxyfutalosine synthase